MREAYGPIPDARRFQHNETYGYEEPKEIHGWEWASTFGRWSALVTFANGWRGFTYPAPPGLDSPDRDDTKAISERHQIDVEKVIDLTPAIAAIEDAYSDAYRNPEALAALKDVWGGVHANDAGVMVATEKVQIELRGNPRWRAQITLTHAPNGLWAMATSYDTPNSDGGSAPSVWDHTAYADRDAALSHGFAKLLGIFERLHRSPHATEADAAQAGRMLEQLRDNRRQTQQLTLF